MLDKHLIAKTNPKANEKNNVFFGDYRVTVLFDRLFRVEKDSKKKYCDKATQSIWFRNMSAVSYKTSQKDSYIEIDTDKAILHLDLDFSKSYILINGKKVALTNEENLLGAYRTLDGFDGSTFIYSLDFPTCKLEDGVCSKNGVAVIDDKDSLILEDNGQVYKREPEELDSYIFAYGHDYKDAVKALYDISGYIPLLPKYALGNWWSRYHVYTQEEYLNIMRKFEEQDIPMTVATIDMDWHPSTQIDKDCKLTEDLRKEEYGTNKEWSNFTLGWTGYSWNKRLFPDYKKLLKQLNDMGLAITLNLHPKDGVRFFEDQYEEMCKAMGKKPDLTPVEFDLTDTNFINNYFKILHKPFEHDGVKFWWIDWQQGTKTKMEGLDPLWLLNHYHFLDNEKEHAGLVLSRYCKIGSHRYPIGFSADTVISYNTLRYLPYFTSTGSNVGYTWWSHDIGGHHMGYKDDELFVRSVQYGVFSPILRLHCTELDVVTKEPWAYPNGSGLLVCEALRLRHRMIPFIYSESYKGHTEGTTLIEPLYYEYPECQEAYDYKSEYFFGGLLVAPITSHTSSCGMSELEVWFPEGTWTDIFTNEVYKAPVGGKKMKVYRWLDSIPVFAKAGTTLPLSGDKHTNSIQNPKNLELHVYEGNGSYKLYEDKDQSIGFTNIETEIKDEKSITTLSFEGDTNVVPDNRSLKLFFHNCNAHSLRITKNGKAIECEEYVDDYLQIYLNDYDPSATYTFEVALQDLSNYFELRTLDSLKRFDFDNTTKETILKGARGYYINSKREKVVDPNYFPMNTYRVEEIMGHFNFPDIYVAKINEVVNALK